MPRLPSLHPSALRYSSRLYNLSDTVRIHLKAFLPNLICPENLTQLLLALTWRIVYIGQASDSEKDQILEEAEMDEIQPGQMKFVFEVISLISIIHLMSLGSTSRCFEDHGVRDCRCDRHFGHLLIRQPGILQSRILREQLLRGARACRESS